jgi:hypothetical protein
VSVPLRVGVCLSCAVHVDEAEGRLRDLLSAAGVTGARDSSYDRIQPATKRDVVNAWSAFRQFAAEPVTGIDPDPEGDGILAEYIVVDWFQGQGEHFVQSLTRQFAFVDEDGEYSHMAQLHCEFLYIPTPEARAAGERNLWSFGRSLDEFFDKALALPGFQYEAEPVGLKVWYSDV